MFPYAYSAKKSLEKIIAKNIENLNCRYHIGDRVLEVILLLLGVYSWLCALGPSRKTMGRPGDQSQYIQSMHLSPVCSLSGSFLFFFKFMFGCHEWNTEFAIYET